MRILILCNIWNLRIGSRNENLKIKKIERNLTNRV